MSNNDGDETQLGQGRNAIVQALLFDDLSVLQTQHGRPGEVHLATRGRRQSPNEEIVECRPGMRATAFPTSDHVVALGNQVGSAPEVEIRKRLAKVGHECLDIGMSAPRLMKRVVQQHVWGSDFVHDGEIAGLAPEVGEPAADDGLVVILNRHWAFLLYSIWMRFAEA